MDAKEINDRKKSKHKKVAAVVAVIVSYFYTLNQGSKVPQFYKNGNIWAGPSMNRVTHNGLCFLLQDDLVGTAPSLLSAVTPKKKIQ